MLPTLRRLSLPAVIALAVLAAAPSADAGVRRFKLRAGPYKSGNYNVLFPKELVRAPRVNGYITDMDVRLVDRKGRAVTIRDVMLHHVVFKNASRFVGRNKACKAPNGEAFFGTGEERQALDLPAGYGYPVKRSDRWRMNVMLMSHSERRINVYVEYTGRIVTGHRLRRVVPYWVGAHGCSSNPSYPVYGGGGPGSVDRRSHTWQVPITGRIVAAGGHLHGGSLNMYVTQKRCGNRVLYDNKPLYGNPDHIYYRARPVLHEPGPINTRWFSSRTGIPVTQGEKLVVTGEYDNSVPHTRVMAITHIYITPSSKRPKGCAPLPADATQTRRVTHGRALPPFAPVPLNTLNANLQPVEIDRPAGPAVFLRSGATVDLKNFRFSRPNVVMRPGSTLTWRFVDTAKHNVTWASGPALVGSRTLSGGARDTTRFTRVGTYKLFCYLHPMTMHEVVEVKPEPGQASAVPTEPAPQPSVAPGSSQAEAESAW